MLKQSASWQGLIKRSVGFQAGHPFVFTNELRPFFSLGCKCRGCWLHVQLELHGWITVTVARPKPQESACSSHDRWWGLTCRAIARVYSMAFHESIEKSAWSARLSCDRIHPGSGQAHSRPSGQNEVASLQAITWHLSVLALSTLPYESLISP
jgi:hypothetical protein